MISLALSLFLAASPACPAPTRSAAQAAAFKKQWSDLYGGLACPRMCRTYAFRKNAEGRVVLQVYEQCGACNVDHICPLACGGRDDPSNMQWLDKKENLAKGADCTDCRPDLYRPGCP